MVAIVSVSNGVTVEDHSNLNQYKDTLSSVLGITDTAQDALGRLVCPRSAAAPTAPSEAQVYYDTDDDTPYYQTGGGLWLPLQGVLQSAGVALDGVVALGTSERVFLEVSLTTTGGSVLVAGRAYYVCIQPSTATAKLYSALTRIGGGLGTTPLQLQDRTVFSQGLFKDTFVYGFLDRGLPAGTYTWQLRGHHGPDSGAWSNVLLQGSTTYTELYAMELTGV